MRLTHQRCCTLVIETQLTLCQAPTPKSDFSKHVLLDCILFIRLSADVHTSRDDARCTSAGLPVGRSLFPLRSRGILLSPVPTLVLIRQRKPTFILTFAPRRLHSNSAGHKLAVPCCSVLYLAVACCTVLYLAVPCCTVLYLTVPCCTLLYVAVRCTCAVCV